MRGDEARLLDMLLAARQAKDILARHAQPEAA